MHGKSPCIFLYSGKQKNRAAPHSPAQPGAFRLSHDVKRSLKRVFASGARRGRSPVFSGNPDPADRPDAPLLYHKTVSHVLTHSVYCLITLLSHSYHTLITLLLHCTLRSPAFAGTDPCFPFCMVAIRASCAAFFFCFGSFFVPFFQRFLPGILRVCCDFLRICAVFFPL